MIAIEKQSIEETGKLKRGKGRSPSPLAIANKEQILCSTRRSEA